MLVWQSVETGGTGTACEKLKTKKS